MFEIKFCQSYVGKGYSERTVKFKSDLFEANRTLSPDCLWAKQHKISGNVRRDIFGCTCIRHIKYVCLCLMPKNIKRQDVQIIFPSFVSSHKLPVKVTIFVDLPCFHKWEILTFEALPCGHFPRTNQEMTSLPRDVNIGNLHAYNMVDRLGM